MNHTDPINHLKLFIFIMVAAIFLRLPTHCLARDFLVTYVSENYRETPVPYSYNSRIYHSIQVNSPAGPKLLVLEGDDDDYRAWLRQCIAQDKEFLLVVDDNEVDRFIASKLYKTPLRSIHPVTPGLWDPEKPAALSIEPLKDGNYFLIVDADEKKSDLFKMIAKKMGYETRVFKDAASAIDAFGLQPDKYNMLVVSRTVPDMKADLLVQKLLNVKSSIPILLESGYGNRGLKKDYTAKFSDQKSVLVKPVLFDDLEGTIESLVKEKA